MHHHDTHAPPSDTRRPYRDAHAFGLSLRDAVVLEALADLADVPAGLTTLCTSIHELAKATGLTAASVQRALSALVTAGFVIRRQEERKSGCIAYTTLLPRCYGLIGAGKAGGMIPPAIAEHLILQPRAVIDAVASALSERRLPDCDDLTPFRGSASEKDRLLDAMREHLSIQDDARAGELMEEERVRTTDCWAVSTGDGTHTVIDHQVFAAAAPANVDAGFLRSVLSTVVASRPDVTAEAIASLLAEAAYSRAVGFVRRHDAATAATILSRVMTRPAWSRPYKIRQDWYVAARKACGLSTGSSASLH